jgi:FAD synthase
MLKGFEFRYSVVSAGNHSAFTLVFKTRDLYSEILKIIGLNFIREQYRFTLIDNATNQRGKQKDFFQIGVCRS